MFIKRLLNQFKRKQQLHEKINTHQEETKPQIRDIDIEITPTDDYMIIDIKEDCNITEYVNALDKIGMKSLELTNGTLFDGRWDIIKRKKIYIINNNNIEYIIYSNDIKTRITEKIKYPEEDEYIDERVIEIDNNEEYTIIRLKHKKSLSTYYVKSYSSKKPNQEFFKLDKEEALKIAKEILSNLNKISYIENIIDLQRVYLSLNPVEKLDYSYKNNNSSNKNKPQHESKEENKFDPIQCAKRTLSKN